MAGIRTFSIPRTIGIGYTNLIVDVCFTNTTSGSINPQDGNITTDAFQVSMVHFWECVRADIVSVIGAQAVSVANAFVSGGLNMRLNICITDLTGANLVRTPSTGPNAPHPA
jgi:hypothetical protein